MLALVIGCDVLIDLVLHRYPKNKATITQTALVWSLLVANGTDLSYEVWACGPCQLLSVYTDSTGIWMTAPLVENSDGDRMANGRKLS